MKASEVKSRVGKNINFEKLPTLPKGSEAFESIRKELKDEEEMREIKINNAHLMIDNDSPQRSRANSQSRASPAQMWFTARARLDKPSLYKTVTLATSKWKR
jgi:hypothetical protein